MPVVGDTPMNFNLVRQIVLSGDIARMYRSPDCLRKYRQFKASLKERDIDMTTNILVTQLKWMSPTVDLKTPASKLIGSIKYSDARPFANEKDMMIMPNAFPYNLEEGIVHLCVWVKFPLPPDPNSEVGDISDTNKQLIQIYIEQTFAKGLGLSKDKVIWFKNWAALQSVKSIPHIHVVIDHPDPAKIEALIGTGGVPIRYGEESQPKL
ncbi:DEKNAAC103609 [Brettanomyces naardenensis]|uniref:DEKNAAC103609 n=1 Tax=Brettanomyces naardenensis TaxID=13370 RepID=A0A448YNW9_BRENA|nr:DEKNAAC103609 [Brettanomyces naardenensis]